MRSVRLRALTAAVLAILASAGLTACRTQAGVAATVEGHRISESTVNSYLTANSQAVQAQSQTGAAPMAPRTYVLQTLITNQLFAKILRDLTNNEPIDEHELKTEINSVLAGDSAQHFVSTHGLVGYSDAFATLALRDSVLINKITTLANNGADINAALAKLKFPVSVNPRYGAWDPTKFTMSSDPAAGLPSVLRVRSGGAVLPGVAPPSQ